MRKSVLGDIRDEATEAVNAVEKIAVPTVFYFIIAGLILLLTSQTVFSLYLSPNFAVLGDNYGSTHLEVTKKTNNLKRQVAYTDYKLLVLYYKELLVELDAYKVQLSYLSNHFATPKEKIKSRDQVERTKQKSLTAVKNIQGIYGTLPTEKYIMDNVVLGSEGAQIAKADELKKTILAVNAKNITQKELLALYDLLNTVLENRLTDIYHLKTGVSWNQIMKSIDLVTKKIDPTYSPEETSYIPKISYSKLDFDANQGKILLYGNTYSVQNIHSSLLANLIDYLEKSSLFKDVKIKKNLTSQNDNYHYKGSFELVFELQEKASTKDQLVTALIHNEGEEDTAPVITVKRKTARKAVVRKETVTAEKRMEIEGVSLEELENPDFDLETVLDNLHDNLAEKDEENETPLPTSYDWDEEELDAQLEILEIMDQHLTEKDEA